MDAAGVTQWLNKGVKPFIKPQFGVCARSAMLVLDSYRDNLTNEVKAKFKELNIVQTVIREGCTAEVQPLDMSVNKSFKASVCQQYQSWFKEDGISTLTAAGFDPWAHVLFPPSIVLIASALSFMWCRQHQEATT
ncbi:unnamed protein product [Closterium sp. NIES-53]